MSLVNFTPNTQHYGLTGRKTSVPYNKMLMAQLPAARQFMADEARRLQTESQYNDQQALQRKLQKAQEEQQKTDTLIRAGNLALDVGKLTKDSWQPALKEAAASVLGSASDFTLPALSELIPITIDTGANLAANAVPVVMDAAKNTIAGMAGEQAVKAGGDALSGVVADTAAKGAVEGAAQTGIGSMVGNILSQASTYMNPWIAAGVAAAKLAGSGLTAIAGNNGGYDGDYPQIMMLGETLQEIDSGGGVVNPIARRLIDHQPTQEAILDTMDVFNPIGAMNDGDLGQLARNVIEKPARNDGMFFSGDFIGGIYNSIWGKSDASNAVFTLLNPIAGSISNIFSAIKKSCIIITACTSDKSPEVEIARAYRDKYLKATDLRGYYMLAEKLVPKMEARPWLKELIGCILVKPLIAYGKHALGKTTIKPAIYARIITRTFLLLIKLIGKTRKQFTRANGEVI